MTTLLLLLFGIAELFAQGTPPWLEESLHGSGKMNAVIAVVAIILIGVGLWMFAMDRKLRSLEERMRNGNGKGA